MWPLLDIGFVLFHTALILFNLLGWMIPRTRRLNLLTLVLTGSSWTLLGLFYGFGYCPLTDWHWQVLEKMGASSPHISYIQYLIERTLGLQMRATAADNLTLAAYLVSLACSVWVNVVKRKRKTPRKTDQDNL
jgi:hypothetical protein